MKSTTQTPTVPPKTSDAQTIVSLRSRNAELSRYVKELTETVSGALAQIDETLKLPDAPYKTGRILGLLEGVRIQNDSAIYYGLGIDPKTGHRWEKK